MNLEEKIYDIIEQSLLGESVEDTVFKIMAQVNYENERLQKRVAELEGDTYMIDAIKSESIEHTVFKDKNVSLDVSMYQQNTFLEIEEVITYGYSSTRICLEMKTDDFVDQLKNIIAAHNKKFNDSRKG